MHPLNRYSIALIVVYLTAFLLMEHGSQSSWTNELIQTLPIIVMMIIWSEILTTRLNDKKQILPTGSFHRDFFIITYATLFAFLASLLVGYNNSDARGWWSFLILAAELYGLILGFVFASFALLLNKQHVTYTLIFAVALAINFSTLKLMPPYILTPFGDIGIFPACALLLLSVHVLVCLGYRLSKVNRFKK